VTAVSVEMSGAQVSDGVDEMSSDVFGGLSTVQRRDMAAQVNALNNHHSNSGFTWV
jgi:hypothetical protein